MKQDKINRVLNCSYKEFLEIYKDQNSQNEYHLKRGDINISFTNWITSSDSNNNGSETNNEERTIKFQAPINAPQSVLKIIGKNATTINEQQKIQVNHKQSSIDIATFYQPDIMGEYFSVETEWHLKTLSSSTSVAAASDSTQQQCSLELIIRVTFNMSFVGNLFEVFIVKAASESALQYVDIVEEYLVKLNIEKQQQLQKQQLQQQQQFLQLKQKEQQLQFLQQQLQLKQKEQQNKPKNKKEKTNKKNRQPKQKPYENWTVDCNIDQIKGDLNHHLDTLRLNSLDASQGLLKVEISISEMQSEQQLIQQQQQLQLQLQQQQQHLQLQNVNNNNNQQLQLQLPNSPTNSSTSTSADSSSSFLSPYNLGLTDSNGKNRQLQQYNNQQQQQQQQLQNQYLQQQQQNHNISNLLSQIELNNRALKEQRLVSEERVEDEIKSISQYFEDMLKLQEESKPWFPSFVNISLVIVVIAVALSIFSKFKNNRSPIKPIIAAAITTANSIGGNNSGSNIINNSNTRNKIFN